MRQNNITDKSTADQFPMNLNIVNVEDESLCPRYVVNYKITYACVDFPTVHCNCLPDNHVYIVSIKDSKDDFRYAFLALNKHSDDVKDNTIAISMYTYDIMFDKFHACVYELNDENMIFLCKAFSLHLRVTKKMFYQTIIAMGLYGVDLHEEYYYLLGKDQYISKCNMATALKRDGKYEKALKTLEEANELEPHIGTAYYNAGKIYFILNDIENSIKSYVKAYNYTTEDVSSEQILVHLGIALMCKENPDSYYSQAICVYLYGLDPYNQERHRRGVTSNSAAKNLEKAKAKWKVRAKDYVDSHKVTYYNNFDARTHAERFAEITPEKIEEYLSGHIEPKIHINKIYSSTKEDDEMKCNYRIVKVRSNGTIICRTATPVQGLDKDICKHFDCEITAPITSWNTLKLNESDIYKYAGVNKLDSKCINFEPEDYQYNLMNAESYISGFVNALVVDQNMNPLFIFNFYNCSSLMSYIDIGDNKSSKPVYIKRNYNDILTGILSKNCSESNKLTLCMNRNTDTILSYISSLLGFYYNQDPTKKSTDLALRNVYDFIVDYITSYLVYNDSIEGIVKFLAEAMGYADAFADNVKERIGYDPIDIYRNAPCFVLYDHEYLLSHDSDYRKTYNYMLFNSMITDREIRDYVLSLQIRFMDAFERTDAGSYLTMKFHDFISEVPI